MHNIIDREELTKAINTGKELIRYDTKGRLSTNDSMNIVRELDSANYIVVLEQYVIVAILRQIEE